MPANLNLFEVSQTFFELQNISDPAQMHTNTLDQSWKWIYSRKLTASVTRSDLFQMYSISRPVQQDNQFVMYSIVDWATTEGFWVEEEPAMWKESWLKNVQTINLL